MRSGDEAPGGSEDRELRRVLARRLAAQRVACKQAAEGQQRQR